MSEEKEPESVQTAAGPETPPPSPARKQKSVFVYLAILFAAAFLLLLFAYLMQQRNSAEILGNLSDLRESMTSFHSLDEVMDENRALREENEKLQNQLRERNTELSNAQSAYEILEGSCDDQAAQMSMLETLYFAEAKFAEEDYAGAAAELAGFDTAELEREIAKYDAQMLHSNPSYAVLGERYEALTAALTEEGYLIRDDSGKLTAVTPEEE